MTKPVIRLIPALSLLAIAFVIVIAWIRSYQPPKPLALDSFDFGDHPLRLFDLELHFASSNGKCAAWWVTGLDHKAHIQAFPKLDPGITAWAEELNKSFLARHPEFASSTQTRIDLAETCHWRWFGFAASRDHYAVDPIAPIWRYVVVIPSWAILLPFVISAGWSLYRLHGRRRTRRLLRCDFCGYDLRASSDRCPECGTPFQLDSTTASFFVR